MNIFKEQNLKTEMVAHTTSLRLLFVEILVVEVLGDTVCAGNSKFKVEKKCF